MNAKQRKIAARMRERALLDSDEKLRKIEASLRELAAERQEFEENCRSVKETLADQINKHNKEVTEFREERANAMKTWLEETGRLENVNIVREALLQLELDVDPAEIALGIRKQLGLIIPEW